MAEIESINSWHQESMAKLESINSWHQESMAEIESITSCESEITRFCPIKQVGVVGTFSQLHENVEKSHLV